MGIYKKLLLIVLCLGFFACEKEQDFYFDIDHLLHTHWGIPHVIEPGLEPINLSAPTIFYPEGHVTIGPDKTDFWRIHDTRSIQLQESGETWFIINLSPDTLYVEKTRFPQGTFIVKCIYFPMEQ